MTIHNKVMRLDLVKSLDSYVSGDDIALPRDKFLQTVAERIRDDLRTSKRKEVAVYLHERLFVMSDEIAHVLRCALHGLVKFEDGRYSIGEKDVTTEAQQLLYAACIEFGYELGDRWRVMCVTDAGIAALNKYDGVTDRNPAPVAEV
jgi:hypothetical protein